MRIKLKYPSFTVYLKHSKKIRRAILKPYKQPVKDINNETD
jgi:hypothetical protein